MPDDDPDAPHDHVDADGSDADDADPDADDADAEDTSPYEPVEGDDPTAPPLPPAVIHRFLASPRALRVAKKVLRALVPKQQVEDLATDALLRALKAPPPHREAVLPGWFAMIVRRRAADWLRKRARREKHEGALPVRVAREDAYSGEAIDDGDALDPSYDPATDEVPVEILGADLDRLIGDHARDLDVRAMVREHDEGKSYADIAAARDLTAAQVANRILRFKTKYTARVRKRREDRMILWVLVLGAALGIAAAYFLWLRPRVDEIRPDPSRSVPTSPSASASAPVLLQALPPLPEPSAPPDDGNKPKAPRP